MVLDMQSMTVGGRGYLVSTTDVKQNSGTGIGANNKTAVAVGRWCRRRDADQLR